MRIPVQITVNSYFKSRRRTYIRPQLPNIYKLNVFSWKISTLNVTFREIRDTTEGILFKNRRKLRRNKHPVSFLKIFHWKTKANQKQSREAFLWLQTSCSLTGRHLGLSIKTRRWAFRELFFFFQVAFSCFSAKTLQKWCNSCPNLELRRLLCWKLATLLQVNAFLFFHSFISSWIFFSSL